MEYQSKSQVQVSPACPLCPSKELGPHTRVRGGGVASCGTGIGCSPPPPNLHLLPPPVAYSTKTMGKTADDGHADMCSLLGGLVAL